VQVFTESVASESVVGVAAPEDSLVEQIPAAKESPGVDNDGQVGATAIDGAGPRRLCNGCM